MNGVHGCRPLKRRLDAPKRVGTLDLRIAATVGGERAVFFSRRPAFRP